MIYPTGHRMQWRPNITPRKGSQAGALTREWHQYDAFPWVRWDGETTEQQEYPECVLPMGQQTQASTRNAWEEKARAR